MSGKFWKEAASLIVVGRAANLNSKIASKDFEVLLLKRSQKSSFFAESYVFPGGMTEPTDFSESWLDVFKKYGYEANDLQKQCRSKTPLPALFNQSYRILPEIGFRIGAVRETFEECGLLLAQQFPYKDLNQQELTKWQHIVHKDGSQFLKMFQELGGFPDILNLHEWSAWLTPAQNVKRRFNTVFFITFMDSIPPIFIDKKEVVDVKVSTPQEFLKQFKDGKILLPPPQLYEFGRFLNFETYEELEKFACERGRKGIELLFPVKIITSNGVIRCLPGDDLYPQEPDYIGEQEVVVYKESTEELREQAKNIHRMETNNMTNFYLATNISPKYGHVTPTVSFMEGLKSKV